MTGYCGHWESFAEYAEQLADDTDLTCGWPDEACRYFNWAVWTRDLEMDHTVVNALGPEHGVHIFRDL